MTEIIGNIIIGIGIGFTCFGIAGLFRFNDFFTRLLVSSKIDTVGALTLIIGVAVRMGFSFFTGKILFLAVIMLIFNPLVAHVLARSAHISEKDINEKAKEEAKNQAEGV